MQRFCFSITFFLQNGVKINNERQFLYLCIHAKPANDYLEKWGEIIFTFTYKLITLETDTWSIDLVYNNVEKFAKLITCTFVLELDTNFKSSCLSSFHRNAHE